MSGMLDSSASLALLAALLGLCVGIAYFRALRRTVDVLAGGRGWPGPLALTALRLGGAAVLFGLMARLGAMPLLGGFLGFLLARAIALRAMRRSC